MKKRMLALFACVMALTLVLAGCVRTEVGIELNPDGSGTVGTIVLIQKDAYEMMKESGDPFEGKETYTETIDDEEYIGTRETAVYGSADELKAALLALTFAGNVSGAENRVSDEEPENLTGEIVIAPEAEETGSEQAAIFKSVDIVKDGGSLTFRAVLIQLCLCKLGVGLMLNMHVFWGVACMVLAVKTPKFLQDFLITTGGGGGGAVVNNVYHSVRLVQMLKKGGG